MRATLLLCVLLLAFVSLSVSVPVQYKLCNTGTPLIDITSVEADEWPPKKGTTMHVIVKGVLSKGVTGGTWTERIHISGFPLPPTSGNLDEVKPLPWDEGDIEFDLNSDIPSSSPSGSYDVQISAVDENKAQIFCVDLQFNLGVLEEVEQMNDRKIPRIPPKSAEHIANGPTNRRRQHPMP